MLAPPSMMEILAPAIEECTDKGSSCYIKIKYRYINIPIYMYINCTFFFNELFVF